MFWVWNWQQGSEVINDAALCKTGNIPFQGPIFINKKEAIEQLLQNNHKYGSRSQYFNNYIDTSRSCPTKDSIALHTTKVNSVLFEDTYDHINLMENNNYDTHIVDSHE